MKPEEYKERVKAVDGRKTFTLDKKVVEEKVDALYDWVGLKKPQIVWEDSLRKEDWKDMGSESFLGGMGGSTFTGVFVGGGGSGGSVNVYRKYYSKPKAFVLSGIISGSRIYARSREVAFLDEFILVLATEKQGKLDIDTRTEEEIYLSEKIDVAHDFLLQAKEAGLGFWYEKKDVLYLVPDVVHERNGQGMFHSDSKSAIMWPNGEGFYFLNGVYFDKELWEQVVSGGMDFKQVLELRDIDQRTQAMRYCPPREFLESVGKLLDKSKKGNELYLVKDDKNIFSVDAYFLLYKDPSTEKEYMKGIDPEIGIKKNADYAQAQSHSFELKQYYKLIEA